MVKRPTSRYVCNNCGAVETSWSGKCPKCGEWNTLTEQLSTADLVKSAASGNLLTPLSVHKSVAADQTRLISGMSDVDMVLGGGIVQGSVNLIAGQPGIGKSTLLLQLAHHIVANGVKVLYVSAEESVHQIGLRAQRLGAVTTELQLVSSNSADDIAATILSGKYKLVIVDSIQAITSDAINSLSGSVSQITNSTRLLTLAAKQSDTAIIIVGHVTKEGAIAGPKVLEHVVDVVLHLDGDRYGGFKVLRAVKNRFGSTNDAGIFEMLESGLKSVVNPSAALLAERQISDGSVVMATVEGTRPLLVEVQALVNHTIYGYPKRAASGFDLNRLNLLVAMLERRTKLKLSDQDIYINIVGGMQLRDPAADLAICLAIGSAAKGLKLKQDVVVFGEVGLSGEIRHVELSAKRLTEAKKLGFKGAIGPTQKNGKETTGLYGVPDVRTALNKFLVKD
ncbi:MAG TPA: DNA repair protein RadA [Candidatus Saccharimonadales bacterium]|nr:DNA repair protein RadA [Candidatus Saccharimonadales bacterium]